MCIYILYAINIYMYMHVHVYTVCEVIMPRSTRILTATESHYSFSLSWMSATEESVFDAYLSVGCSDGSLSLWQVNLLFTSPAHCW